MLGQLIRAWVYLFVFCLLSIVGLSFYAEWFGVWETAFFINALTLISFLGIGLNFAAYPLALWGCVSLIKKHILPQFQ